MRTDAYAGRGPDIGLAERQRAAELAIRESDSPVVVAHARRFLRESGVRETHAMSDGATTAADARERRQRWERYDPDSTASGLARPSSSSA